MQCLSSNCLLAFVFHNAQILLSFIYYANGFSVFVKNFCARLDGGIIVRKLELPQINAKRQVTEETLRWRKSNRGIAISSARVKKILEAEANTSLNPDVWAFMKKRVDENQGLFERIIRWWFFKQSFNKECEKWVKKKRSEKNIVRLFKFNLMNKHLQFICYKILISPCHVLLENAKFCFKIRGKRHEGKIVKRHN